MGNSHSKKSKREEERKAMYILQRQISSLRQENEVARRENQAIRHQNAQLRSSAADNNRRLKAENVKLRSQLLNGAKEVSKTSKHCTTRSLAIKNPRTIILDGANIAVFHSRDGQRKKEKELKFSPKGIEKAIEWFTSKGHTDVRCILPAIRQHEKASINLKRLPTIDFAILAKLQSNGFIHYVPQRTNFGTPATNEVEKLGKKGKKSKKKGKQTQENSKTHVSHYDDLSILELASQTNGIVVSNDRYEKEKKDAIEDGQDEIVKVIDHNLLTFMFSKDNFVPSPDPQSGVSLPKFLSL